MFTMLLKWPSSQKIFKSYTDYPFKKNSIATINTVFYMMVFYLGSVGYKIK